MNIIYEVGFMVGCVIALVVGYNFFCFINDLFKKK